MPYVLGHITPATYALLAELGIHDKQEVLETYRKPGIYEGHNSRKVKGIPYTAGPLGQNISAAAAEALVLKRA